jgi:four helix bundle protein
MHSNCGDRSKRFAIDIVLLCRALPADWVTRTLGGQLLRSGTSVAANYRAACRGRSDKEFCAKIGLVVEESDESLLWLELLAVGSQAVRRQEYESLLREADELTAIFSASYKTARANLTKRKRDREKLKPKSLNH